MKTKVLQRVKKAKSRIWLFMMITACMIHVAAAQVQFPLLSQPALQEQSATFSYGKQETLTALARHNEGASLADSKDTKDRPNDFKVRGVHLDLRIQVMKLPALKKLALRFSKAGINTIIMEWEGSYPYDQDAVVSNRYAYTPEQVRSFIHYCDSLRIDVIPLQQSFGHLEYILRHDKYAALREDQQDLSQVCPSKPALNKVLFRRLYKEMIETHHSRYIHIGGDETHLLGHCKLCQRTVDSIGVSGLYFNHIKLLCDIVTSLGKTPVLWADIALKYPKYIHLLPKGTVFIDWNYGWSPDRFGALDTLLSSGYEIWGALSIRSYPDNYFLTSWQTHFGNIRDFIPFCRANHYQGIIMTSWSTSGEYAPVYEAENALLDLIPIRRCYPISGFDILISAYLKAIQQKAPLNIKEFITRYSKQEFGFNDQEAKEFTAALLQPQKPFGDGINNKLKGKEQAASASLRQSLPTLPKQRPLLPPNSVVQDAVATAKLYHRLQPKQHKALFAHYRLMQDIRVGHLRFQQIQQAVNQDTQLLQHRSQYVDSLSSLLDTAVALNRRFNALNQKLLYPGALRTENKVREEGMLQLYNRLAQNRDEK